MAEIGSGSTGTRAAAIRGTGAVSEPAKVTSACPRLYALWIFKAV